MNQNMMADHKIRNTAIERPDMRVKNCAYGHSVAILLNPLVTLSRAKVPSTQQLLELTD